MRDNKKNFFFILLSSDNPDTDYIYQCHTDLCIKVIKGNLTALRSSTTSFIYKAVNNCTYIFEMTGNAIGKTRDIQSAIHWYMSYYHLSLRQLT